MIHGVTYCLIQLIEEKFMFLCLANKISRNREVIFIARNFLLSQTVQGMVITN